MRQNCTVTFYGPEEAPEAQELGQKSPASRRVGQKIPINPETPRKKSRSGVPPLQASVTTKYQLGPHSSSLPEGETITSGHLHHPGSLHDEEGVVQPRG